MDRQATFDKGRGKMIMRNYCESCGTRIPRSAKSFGGYRYVPVRCVPCSVQAMRWNWAASPPYQSTLDIKRGRT